MVQFLHISVQKCNTGFPSGAHFLFITATLSLHIMEHIHSATGGGRKHPGFRATVGQTLVSFAPVLIQSSLPYFSGVSPDVHWGVRDQNPDLWCNSGRTLGGLL